MRIIAKTSFKHGRAALEKGGRYDVPERLGGYFEGNGWAIEAKDDSGDFEVVPAETFVTDAPAERAAEETELEIQAIEHITAADVGSVSDVLGE